MKQWPVQDAKAHFSEMLDLCLEEGPQIITRRGEAKAVLAPLGQWQALQARAKPGLKEVLLSRTPGMELDLPERTSWPMRAIPDTD